jgi:hypothetical protein
VNLGGAPPGSPAGDRRAQLAAALRAVRGRITEAARAAGRDAGEIELVAVTKTHPAADAALLADLGQCVFGENRPQEAARKVAELARLRPGAAPRWHLVGRLQRNKARAVVAWAGRVESVDSPRLADALDRAVLRACDLGERTTPLSVLVQVSLDGDPERGGVPVEGVAALVDRVAGARGLALHGLMAVAPLGDPDQDPDRVFAVLQRLAATVRAGHPDARVLSAGMTGDLERAIRYGSTCVRVGTALLGDRRLASG